jgi:hypothetical protein
LETSIEAGILPSSVIRMTFEEDNEWTGNHRNLRRRSSLHTDILLLIARAGDIDSDIDIGTLIHTIMYAASSLSEEGREPAKHRCSRLLLEQHHHALIMSNMLVVVAIVSTEDRGCWGRGCWGLVLTGGLSFSSIGCGGLLLQKSTLY